MFAYEGIGTILPIQDVTADQKGYPRIVNLVVLTMVSLFVAFGFICANFYGEAITEGTTVLQLFPDNWFSWLIKFAFCINLFFSYPLLIYPVINIQEGYLFKGWPKSKKRHWLKNLARTALIFATVAVTIAIGQKIQSFIAIAGAVSCAPLAFTLPSYFHLKTCATSSGQKALDTTIIIVSMAIFVFSLVMGVINW